MLDSLFIKEFLHLNVLEFSSMSLRTLLMPLPELPHGRSTSPRRPPLSPLPPAASSRLSRLARAPSGRAVASYSIAAASSPTAYPSFRAVTPGATFPPSPFSFLRASRLQPPLPPRPSAARPRRLLPRPRSHLLSLGQPSVLRGKHRRRVLAGKTVALPPLFHLRPPLSRFPCAGRRRHHLPRLRDAALHPGCSSVSPERRRPCRPPSFGRPFLLPGSSACCTITTSGIAAARSSSASFPLHPNPSAVHHRRLRSFSSSTSRRSPGSSSRGAASVIVIAAACSTPSTSPCSRCRLSSSPPRRSRSSSSSSSSRHSRSSWRSSLRRAVLVRRPRSSSEPLQPRPRLRPRLRVVKPRAGRVSPSFKDRRRSRSLAVRLRRARSSLSFPRLVAWWLVALLVCFA
ncbi:uncharacterized protein [Oryza sativa Japonica Group]|uniref:uncharacterized protein n=1 Tax=Oryza sativa subsp. japonica TaxID=39947 RepID=UPI00339BF0DD